MFFAADGTIEWVSRASQRIFGIAPEHQERIFRVFERLHSHNEYPGTGIGLSIVRKGVERMGGQVGVELAASMPRDLSLVAAQLVAVREAKPIARRDEAATLSGAGA